MSIARKLALSILPALALALPLSAATSAQAHEHDHFEHHHGYDGHASYDHYVHYGHSEHVFVDRHVYVGGYTPAPVIVTVPRVNLYYRTCPTVPWLVYGGFGGYGDAQIAAQSLQGRGFEIFIR
jgi:hypothetical protein